jgi:hypothetical protein
MLPNTSTQPSQPSQPQRTALPTDTPLAPPGAAPNALPPQWISVPAAPEQQPARTYDDDPSIPMLPIG